MKTETETKKAKAKIADMKQMVYSQDGKTKGDITLPENIFGVKWNGDLVHQVSVSMMANKRAGTAHTKDRGEVRGGGKKPWKQKGTGRARHGSSRSPIWVGGGIAHGPRSDKDYSKKINAKMKVRALFAVLSAKLSSGEILFVDSLKTTKTKDAHSAFVSLSNIDGFSRLKGKRKTALCVFPDTDKALQLSIRNLPQIAFEQLKDLNLVDVLNHKYLVMINPTVSVELLAKKLQK
jgi:large subunit ribosomal protein L4